MIFTFYVFDGDDDDACAYGGASYDDGAFMMFEDARRHPFTNVFYDDNYAFSCRSHALFTSYFIKVDYQILFPVFQQAFDFSYIRCLFDLLILMGALFLIGQEFLVISDSINFQYIFHFLEFVISFF